MCKIAIVGATGAVGQELIYWLHEKSIPYTHLVLIASEKSVGQQLNVNGKVVVIESLQPQMFSDLDIVVFCTSSALSQKWVPEARRAGCLVVDCSSAFRMDEAVPLIIPEINGDLLANEQVIASPNCTASIALMALYPLHRAFKLNAFFASSYQAVSGSGYEAIHELENQTKAWYKGEHCNTGVYPHPIAFNVMPQVGAIDVNGIADEEHKFTSECKKILNLPELNISVTCVRVPVFRAHSIAIHASFERQVNRANAIEVLRGFHGIDIIDNPQESLYPTPAMMAGRVLCGIGRIRLDEALENGLAFWVVGDQLWKGAALNTAQILELISKRFVTT